MKCKKCRNNLIGFIRGQLPEPELVLIREHLTGCEECRLFASYLSSTLNVIQAEKQLEPDPFLATRIEGILQAGATPARRLQPMLRLIPAAVFTFFILAGIAGGFGLGELIAPRVTEDQMARNELTILIDDLQQEPLETFIMGFEATE
jgi:predicted anti-sigma-YlaC factor YlaD